MKRLRWLVQLLLTVVILHVLVVPAPAEAASLKLTYPKGGEFLFVGTTTNITWTWDGDPQELIYISFSADEGLNWVLVSTGTGGSYAWTVPNIVTDKARIAVSTWGNISSFGSVFTITKQLLLPPGPLLTSPHAPSNLTISEVTSNSLTLNWVDNAANETGFKIERKTGDGSWTQITQVGANTTSYSNTGLSPLTSYSYRVRAYNFIGNSAYSNEPTATTKIAVLKPVPIITFPAAPSDLVATEASSTTLSLSWMDNAINEAGFRIERREPGELWAQIAEVGANATSYLDMGLSPDTVYDYRVRSYNTLGNSSPSNEASARTMPTPPPPPAGQTFIRLTIGSTRYYVDGSQRNMDVAPISREGRTLLPIRYVADPLGAVVRWDPGDQKVTIMLKTRQGLGASEPEEEEEPVQPRMVELWIGQNRARVNGAYQYIDPANQNVVPIIVPPGRTMLPLRFIAEALGCQVEWNGVTQEVIVIYPAP